MPQATIKLQAAPAPASAARKPVTPSAAPDSAKTVAPEKTEAVTTEAEEDASGGSSEGEIPLPIAIAAAALAFLALAVQLWAFIS